LKYRTDARKSNLPASLTSKFKLQESTKGMKKTKRVANGVKLELYKFEKSQPYINSNSMEYGALASELHNKFKKEKNLQSTF
jgi:hypothetical protein